MNNNNGKINKIIPEKRVKKEDSIINMSPEAIKMDILLFKNDALREIKQIEKRIIDKSKETNDILKDKIALFDTKMNFINEQIKSVSNKMVDGIKIEERINTLIQAREQLLDQTTTNKIKLSMVEKETRDSINRIDGILKESIVYPGVIGVNGKFLNFHDFIDFVITESNLNNNFRQKNIMDLSSYKLKIEKALQALGFKIESILSSCNSFTLTKIKELQERFDYSIDQYKEKLNELRIENSNYVIQLEKDTKDLRNETNIIKNMKSDIFSKIDNDVNNMKKDNANIIQIFETYKGDFEKINEDLSKLEKIMENNMSKRILILFDEQKKIYENIDKIKKEHNDFINVKINDKIKDIVNEQIKNAFKDNTVNQINLNSMLIDDNININNTNFNQNYNQNIIINQNQNQNNNINNNNNQNNNINNNINNNLNNNQYKNYNYNLKNNLNNNQNNIIINNNIPLINSNNIIKDKNNDDIYNDRKSYFFPRHHFNNLINNNSTNNINFTNRRMSIYSSPKKRMKIDYENNYNLNTIFHGRTNNNFNNNIIMNQKILENLKNNMNNTNNINGFNNNNSKIVSTINNNINENILSEIKNDNILSIKKSSFHKIQPKKKSSFQSDSIQEENNNKYNKNIHFEPNVNKYSIISRNKKKAQIKYKFKSEKENNINYDDYIKIFNVNKNKISHRKSSFDQEKKEDLQKFQKLLKININDVDAKLNNADNSSSSSFELLNENQEIFDPFTNTKENLQNNNNNINENIKFKNDSKSNFSKINILSSPLQNVQNSSDRYINEEDLSTKNIMAAKTSSDFYPNDQRKRKIESTLKANKNKKIFQLNKKINEKNSIKKTNSDLLNLQSNLKSRAQNSFNQNFKVSFLGTTGDQIKKQNEDSIHKYHNYFIGFQFGSDDKKIKKHKRRNKSNKYY